VPKAPKGTKLDKKELKKNKMKNNDVVEKVVNAWRELALTPAHKLHPPLQNRFGISHTFHKFQIS
jgi:hypothetical protein